MQQSKPDETAEERQKRKLIKVNKAFNKTVILYNNNRPFYSPKVYDTLDSIFREARHEMIDYEFLKEGRGSSKEEIEQRDKRISSILDNMDLICDNIRERIQYDNQA